MTTPTMSNAVIIAAIQYKTVRTIPMKVILLPLCCLLFVMGDG